MPSHTPGPKELFRLVLEHTNIEADELDLTLEALSNIRSEAEIGLRSEAAAPELVRALEAIIESRIGLAEFNSDLFVQARTALAKAKGGT